MASIRELPRQVLTQWRGLTRRAQIAISATTALCLLALGYVILTSGTIDYAPLYAGLSTEDAGAIVDKLHELHIPYRVGRGGESVEVPRDKVPELRLQLASLGLPRGGGIGYELFDKQGLGVSDFTQRVNFHRALQGELERSIGTLQAVQHARVHLVVPEKSLFRTAAEQASASVVLTLRPGAVLLPQQVQGIVHLVASSVEGLNPGRITVVDQRGDVLSQKTGEGAAATAALTYQREIEQTSARRAQDMLEKTLGKGHAAVQVSAQVDTSQVERTHEEYNPDQQVVRSEQEVEDVVGPGGDATGGVAGARGNLPGGPPPQTTPAEGSRRRSQTRNYEISKVLRKVTQPVGKLERLTVAVLVDGTYQPQGADKKAKKYVPRTKEELETYAAIVKEAVGFDEKRGDQLEVRSVPFAPGEESEMSETRDVVPPWAYGALAVAFLLIGVFVAQLLGRRRRLGETTLLPAGMMLPSSVQQLEESLSPPQRVLAQTQPDVKPVDSFAARAEALEAISKNPDRAALVLRSWINEPNEPAEPNAGHGPGAEHPHERDGREARSADNRNRSREAT